MYNDEIKHFMIQWLESFSQNMESFRQNVAWVKNV